jgi:hypothetical protein
MPATLGTRRHESRIRGPGSGLKIPAESDATEYEREGVAELERGRIKMGL